MSAHDETSTGRSDEPNDPVDVALEIALEDADDGFVREHIRRAQQRRIVLTHEATDPEVRDAVQDTERGDA